MARERLNALLIVGPTGSGKSPLGDYLESHGLWGHRCVHFDFGKLLRQVASAPQGYPELSTRDVDYVREVLTAGALLENETFYIASAIFNHFCREQHVTGGDLIILNGLPRHVGQSRELESLVRVIAVVRLACDASVVFTRIRKNTGGDRTDRIDDGPEEIEKKLRIFEERTVPLIEYYRASGAALIAAPVQCDTTPDTVANTISLAGPAPDFPG